MAHPDYGKRVLCPEHAQRLAQKPMGGRESRRSSSERSERATRERSERVEAMIGSVAKTLVERSTVPVTVVR